MAVTIALLRGINVGGQKLIKMTELKRAFEAMGFSRVQTYIQSGNILFDAEEEETSLRRRVEYGIAETFGFPVPTILRTAEGFEHVLAACPFRPDELAQGETLYVYFLAEAPSQGGVDRLLACQSDVDEYRIAGREVYLLCRQSIRKSIFTNNLLEKKLGVSVTARNWQTVSRLAQLAKAMQ